jgi:hypothetical protein
VQVLNLSFDGHTGGTGRDELSDDERPPDLEWRSVGELDSGKCRPAQPIARKIPQTANLCKGAPLPSEPPATRQCAAYKICQNTPTTPLLAYLSNFTTSLLTMTCSRLALVWTIRYYFGWQVAHQHPRRRHHHATLCHDSSRHNGGLCDAQCSH